MTSIDFHIDMDKATRLVNNKKTTVDDLCKFVYEGIKKFQEEREHYYLEQIKFEFNNSTKEPLEEEFTTVQADAITKKIVKDTQIFSVTYAKNSIDAVLDAINQKRFKNKTGPQNLLVLLSTLQEMNE